jgi:hypothetical protein
MNLLAAEVIGNASFPLMIGAYRQYDRWIPLTLS